MLSQVQLSTPTKHVQFSPRLASPPANRSRADGVVYPKVAQSKGTPDRVKSKDLYWGPRRLSSVCPSTSPGEETCGDDPFEMNAPSAAVTVLETSSAPDAGLVEGVLQDEQTVLPVVKESADLLTMMLRRKTVPDSCVRPHTSPLLIQEMSMPPLSTPSSSNSSRSCSSCSNVTPTGSELLGGEYLAGPIEDPDSGLIPAQDE